MTRTARSAAIAALTVLAAIAAIIAADLTTPAQAQSDGETAGRIAAHRLADGRTELGWEPRTNAGWGERILPSGRYLPANAAIDRWLHTTPVEVEGVEIGRIEALKRRNGGIELAFRPTGGERIEPLGNYLPSNIEVGSWRHTSEITLGSSEGEAPAVGAGSALSAVSAGSYYTCGLRETGAVKCWGANEAGQADAPAGQFSAVSAGDRHTCGLRETGAVECWGDNDWGQRDAPAGRFSALSAGGPHTCGLRETGAVECWGRNRYGQAVAPAERFSALSAGGSHTCGLRDSGAVVCWGYNSDGQADAPAGQFSAVSAGWYHTCGLRETGTVECWGNNGNGQADAPAGRFSAVSAGVAHTCGLRESGAVECWGRNFGGQADAPAGRFSAVSAGGWHTCGLRETGAVECWGWNVHGQADVPEDLATPAEPATAGCPEPAQLFRVTETSPVARRIVREERLDTDCQVDGLPRGAVRPADRYAFTLDKPSRVSVELWSTAFAAGLFLTDANGAYYYLDGTEAEGGRRLSLSGSRAADGEGDAIIGSDTGYLPNPGVPVSIPASLKRVRLEPGSYWLFAVSASGSRTGNYRLTVEYERIADSESLGQRIAERFAPVLLFEEGEQFFPVPVELMIRNSTLHYTQNGQERAKAPGTYGLADLISYNGQEAYLDLADEEHGSKGTGERVVYARVVEPAGTGGGTLVQYWFFYLFNATGEALSSHEGDWESVQLWFADVAREDMHEALVPTWMGYAAHEGGWALSQDLESCSGTDALLWPSVYVARNRHASYVESLYGWPSLDKSKLQWTSGDQFHGNGQVWALQGRDVPDVEGEVGYEIRLLPEGFDGTWLAWDGRWGDLGDLGLGKDGPLGPAWKEHFWALPPILPVLKGGDDGWSEAPFRCFPRVPR